MRNTLIFLSGLLLLTTPACDSGGGDDDGSTSGSPTGDPTGDDTTTTPTGGEALSCADYCSTVTTNCKLADAQYFDKADGVDNGMTSCMAVCAGFPEGTAADTAMNTLGCRTYHAGAAAMDSATHCPHAGPGGAGVCGANCEGFCSGALELCGSSFADMGACMTECAAFADTVRYDTSQTAGNTLACRIYHLTAAGVDAAAHCPHILAASPPCM